MDYCVESGVEVMYDTRVSDVLAIDGKVYGVRYFNKRGFERKEEAPNVIIATGGVSYPLPARRVTDISLPTGWAIRSRLCGRLLRRCARRIRSANISTACC